jgi:hypothetical protein
VATGDVTKSQDALQTAMDVSAATGKDLATVTTAIAKGYTGNTTALTRLGAGLDKTLLKTGRMDLIMKQLATTFKGDAAIAADTTAGKMARVGEAARQATVAIGEGLISSFQSLVGGGSITNATNEIVKFGKAIGDAIAGIGDLIAKVRNTSYLGDFFSHLFKGLANTSALSTIIKFLDKVHADTLTSTGIISPTVQAAIDQGNAQAQAKALALKAKQLAAEKAILATQKAQTLEQKNQALLKILGTAQQDFERANLMAALAHAQTQEVKDQLQYQLDLLDATNQTGAAQAKTIDNAIILKEKMLLAQGQVMLVDGSIVNLSEAKNPFAGFDKYVQDALNAILKLNQAIVTLPQPFIGFTGANNYGGLAGNSGTYGFGNPTTTVSPTDGSSTTGFVGNNNYGGLGGSTGFGNASSTTSSINLNLSLDPGLIVSTTNASTANGSPVTINRLSNQFASV